jgi:hypothetical protein
MTLSERNTFFKIGIIFCIVCTLLIFAASFLAIYPNEDEGYNRLFGMEENTRRPANIFQAITSFLPNSYFAVHTSLVMSVLFSLIGITLIHSFFERTSTPEILYIAIFTISFAFEIIRLILPLYFIFGFPSLYMNVAFRVLLFVRFFSVFSLFAAGLCAAGLEIQKTRNVIFVITVAALVMTLGVPIDVLNWDTSLNMVSGFSSMFRLIEIAAFLTAIINFFIASKIRGTKEYMHVAVGVLLVFAGRNILLITDNWASPVFGILILSIGTWFISSKLHKIHLWL